ncbi:hypothetical protein GAYE_SCF18G3899 [Galdieria yellowstonensis]|uniref:Uncharacterized protein n=1 Tax=Galdieria yellowstonensis TaxID=3028027 RepID=A0AAV9IEU7_9RHOD|nr:hypothetical protein GAYE_SCF18G3899 [Galdieria yellowstonensis]
MVASKKKNVAKKCLRTAALIVLYLYLVRFEYSANRKLAAKYDFRSAELLLIFQSTAAILVLYVVSKSKQRNIPRLNLVDISTFLPFAILCFISAKCGILVFKSRGIPETSPFKTCLFPFSLEVEKVLFPTNVFRIARVSSLTAVLLSFLCYIRGGEMAYGWLQCVVSRVTYAVFVNGVKKILIDAEYSSLHIFYGIYLALLVISVLVGTVSFSVFDGLKGPPWMRGDFVYTLMSSVLFGIGTFFNQVYLTYFTSPTFVVVLTYVAQESWNLGMGKMYPFSCNTFVLVAMFIALISFLFDLIHESLYDLGKKEMSSLP